MSYKVNRAEGYQPWGVTNPWVFADLSQPQRQRGRVSPLVYKTQPPYLRSPHLGQIDLSRIVGPIATTAADADARAIRMERYALVGLAFSVGSFALFAWNTFRPKLKANRRRREG